MTSNEAASRVHDSARDIVEEQPEVAENTPNRELGANAQPLEEIELKDGAQAKDAEDPKGQADSEGK